MKKKALICIFGLKWNKPKKTLLHFILHVNRYLENWKIGPFFCSCWFKMKNKLLFPFVCFWFNMEKQYLYCLDFLYLLLLVSNKKVGLFSDCFGLKQKKQKWDGQNVKSENELGFPQLFRKMLNKWAVIFYLF